VKKILKNLLIVAACALLVVLGLASTKPDQFRVERSIQIQASPAKVFAYLEDFHEWQAWSPWEGLDPELKRSYSGAAKGLGAVYAWEGNSHVGSGSMEITELAAGRHLKIKLDFIKPFEGHNGAEFTLKPQGQSTELTWAMFGPSPFMAKVMQVFMSMDTVMGKEFDSGLAKLKAAAESKGA
jgi:hypothetical protein